MRSRALIPLLLASLVLVAGLLSAAPGPAVAEGQGSPSPTMEVVEETTTGSEQGKPASEDITVRKLRVNGDTSAYVMTVPRSQIYRVQAVAAKDFADEPVKKSNYTVSSTLYRLTSEMAKFSHASAGINGDFGLTGGRPGHMSIIDGQLRQTSQLGEAGKSLLLGSFGAEIAHQPIHVYSRIFGEGRMTLDGWNDFRADKKAITGFSSGAADNKITGCGLLLDRTDHSGFNADVEHWFEVKSHSCPAHRPTGDQVVLVSQRGTPFEKKSRTLEPGTRTMIGWTMMLYGVEDVIGGSPILVENGKNMTPQVCETYLCMVNPRTGVGVKENGDLLMVVVDGRQGRSRGLTMDQWARLLIDLGAVDALNLDGGGSSTMVSRGRVINSPADGYERPVTKAIVIADPDFSDAFPLAPAGEAHQVADLLRRIGKLDRPHGDSAWDRVSR